MYHITGPCEFKKKQTNANILNVTGQENSIKVFLGALRIAFAECVKQYGMFD